MSADQDSTRPVDIQCLCGRHKYTYLAPLDRAEPLEVFCCHCNSCRHSGGALYHGAVVWKLPLLEATGGPPPVTYSHQSSDPEPIEHSDGKLIHYALGSKLSYWFCGGCSSKMFWRYVGDAAPLEIFPGLLSDDVWKHLRYSQHVFLADTLDGGAARWFQYGKRWTGFSNKSDPYDGSALPTATGHGSTTAETKTMPAHCHCRSNAMQVSTSGAKLPVRAEVGEELRRFTSVEVSCWAEVAVSSLQWLDENGRAVESEEMLRRAMDSENEETALGHFQGEKSLYFCRRCSACICYADRPSSGTWTLWLAVGLLASPRGARAEDILDWSTVGDKDLARQGLFIRQRE